ncbi:Xaa-Pro peptidase family protein [Pseudorhodobacter sp.]|uniref:M24 family metallopeptidase n=1 Tax=Pseudorhodobacter sp. TaxID=1934400 RepID=UPI002648897F|nr:Xaa-Pro peptidase family protein [Pseudorhodobacter sp.]MDN5786441.1 Xaa-Pro peptidase family protein [Pseudorhodobacter sp.]
MDFSFLRGTEASFPEAEYAARQARARSAIAATGYGALLVTSPETICWLTGRQTAGYFALQTLILPVEGAPTLLVRQLELASARATTWLHRIETWQDGEDPVAALITLLHDLGLKAPAIERDGWFISPRTMATIDARFPGLGDGSGVLAPLRAVKSPAELVAIREAACQAEAGLTAGIATCRAGVDENAVAAAMMSAAIVAGSEAMAMEPLVSSGPRSGLPHMTWRRRMLEQGDGVFLEMAASQSRYHAALMRSVWIGKPPARAQAMMDCATDALAAALERCRAGLPCAAPHLAAQAVIDRAGLSAAFRKRIGYSMGIAFAPDWGEGAILSLFEGVERIMEPGMVFHLPATLRDYGAFTVGASETVIITGDGPCEVLSTLPREICVC